MMLLYRIRSASGGEQHWWHVAGVCYGSFCSAGTYPPKPTSAHTRPLSNAPLPPGDGVNQPAYCDPRGYALLAARRPANAASVADVVTRTRAWVQGGCWVGAM